MLEFVDYQAPFLTLRVQCSKGTYIRALGEDIGAALGCGAHLNALRRIQVGDLFIDRAITIEQLTATEEGARSALLAPVDALLTSFPALYLSEELAKRFLHGQRLALGKENVVIPAQEGRVRVYRDADKALLGTGLMQEYSILAVSYTHLTLPTNREV